MLKDCIWQSVDFLTLKNNQNISRQNRQTACRLDHLSAFALTRSTDIFEKYVTKIPPNIFPFLLRTTIEMNYLKYITLGGTTIFGSIGLLVEHWPYETLVLRDNLVWTNPNEQSPLRDLYLCSRIEKYETFIQELANTLLHWFIYVRSSNKKWKLTRLDVSRVGFNIEEYLENIFSDNLGDSHECPRSQQFNKKKGRKRLQDQPVQVVCDISFENQKKLSKFLTNILPSCLEKRKHFGLTTIFEKVSIVSSEYKDVQKIVAFIKGNIMEHLKYFEISLSSINQHLIEDFTSNFSSLEGLGISYCYENKFQFSSLSSMRNLQQLDLSGTSSVDGLEVLGQLETGLNFVRLVGCRIKPKDILDGLMKHTKSLRQVDLSENAMDSADMYQALFKFICDLDFVEIIELEDCKLGRIPEEPLKYFFHLLLKFCNKLKILRLLKNDFSRRLMISSIFSLVEKKSLRALLLTVPSEVYISDDYEIVKENLFILKSTLDNRRKLCGSQVKVEWREDLDYAHWFYVM